MADAASNELSVSALDGLTGELLAEWRERLRRDPDVTPRTGDRGENERLLVNTLLRVMNAENDNTLAALAAAAARYGASQHRALLDPRVLCDQLGELRDVVWQHLKRGAPATKEALGNILRFDRALSIVVKAALNASYSR
jgi:hypothetical protein